MRLHETRLISRSRREVFEYTSDFANIQDWDPGVAASERLGAGPIGVGTRYRVEASFGSSRIPMIYEITEYRPYERVVLVGKGESLHAVDEIRFEPGDHDGETLVLYTAEITFTNFMRYLAPVIAPFMKKVGERALTGLEEALAG